MLLRVENRDDTDGGDDNSFFPFRQFGRGDDWAGEEDRCHALAITGFPKSLAIKDFEPARVLTYRIST